MRNISTFPKKALRLRLRMHKHASVGEALSHFDAVGWCAGIMSDTREAAFTWGGQARLEDGGLPVAQDTIFRVASISKMFGAAAALRLVKRGKLSLDDPASDALGFAMEKPVTLRQLITHTAALDDSLIYDEVLGEPDAPTLDIVVNKSFLGYAPGTKFLYSNLGAGVVGMMVEAASGMMFDDFVRQEFFVPYGLDASFHPQRIVHKERMANCYYVPGNKLAYNAPEIAALPLDDAPDPLRHYAYPAGKLMISAPDLMAAVRRLPKDDPEMFIRQNHIGSVRCDSGRGLGVAIMPKGVFTLEDRTFWGHQGCAYGALCEAWIDLADGTTCISLTNGVKLSSIGPLQQAGQSGVAALLDQR